jgi:hypothetical protein
VAELPDEAAFDDRAAVVDAGDDAFDAGDSSFADGDESEVEGGVGGAELDGEPDLVQVEASACAMIRICSLNEPQLASIMAGAAGSSSSRSMLRARNIYSLR